MAKIFYENLTIAVEQEGDIYRAYAYNSKAEQNIANCKCTREDGAITGLLNELKKDAVQKLCNS